MQAAKSIDWSGHDNDKHSHLEELKKTKDPRIQYLGAIYKEGHIKELHCHCYAYVHGNEVGGTNPALLKALGYGNAVLALNVPFNAEVVKDAGIMYERSVDDVADKMQYLVDNPQLLDIYRTKAVNRILEDYTWTKITDEYEEFFKDLINGVYGGRR